MFEILKRGSSHRYVRDPVSNIIVAFLIKVVPLLIRVRVSTVALPGGGVLGVHSHPLYLKNHKSNYSSE